MKRNDEQKRKVVAVTGGIGAGKSTVMGFLRQKGFATLDCDLIAKQVATNKSVLAAVEQLLGSKAVKNGALDRQYIRSVVFANESLHSRYSKLFHNGVASLFGEQVNALPANQPVFVEIAILDAFSYPWHQVWVVTSLEQTRIERVALRDNVSIGSVVDIVRRQRPYNGTVTLNNDGNKQQLIEQIDAALQNL